jgi:hypothetical protein
MSDAPPHITMKEGDKAASDEENSLDRSKGVDT